MNEDYDERDRTLADYLWLLMFVIFLGLTILSLIGCSNTKYVPLNNEVRVVEKETLVPMPMPQDSASIVAWLECDEKGKVVLKWLDAERSKNARLQFSLDSIGKMVAKMKTVPDTVYLPSKEIILEKRVEVPVPIERKLSYFEKLKIKASGAIYSIIAILVIYVIYKIPKKGGVHHGRLRNQEADQEAHEEVSE